MDCREMILSEEYADYIVSVNPFFEMPTTCTKLIGSIYLIFHEQLKEGGEITDATYGYYSIPKLFGLLDTGNMEVSGIIQVHNQPVLDLKGEGILIGFVDTGIDYANQVFLNPDGTSRVAAIWDQTQNEGTPPEGFEYGTEYTQEMINQAVKSENPYDIVPSRDENGHGTFMAGIAAGNEMPDGSFVGAAPKAQVVAVKLKPAKNYLRNYFRIKDDAIAYQETDILTGLQYLDEYAERHDMPMVVCIGVGTNSGGHNGSLVIDRVISHFGSAVGNIYVAAGGNETDRFHHYLGQYSEEDPYQEVEIRVGEGENGFTLELWAKEPEVYSVAIRSPGGEYIPKIAARLDVNEQISFIFDNTIIDLRYHVIVAETGGFLIIMRFINPTPGLWTLQVYNSLYVTGRYHLWLPMEQFMNPNTVFLRPSPDVTITSPGDASYVISTACYNHRTSGIYQHSSRGFTADSRIKPDIAAPGVDVYGPAPGNRFVTRTGTSVAAAHMAGASALLQEWSIKRLSGRMLSTADAMALFIRGASRRTGTIYPNREWGYGILNVYDVFDRLSKL